MGDYRNYVRASTSGFDGWTFETAVYSQTGFRYATSVSGPVGLFPPASLGRVNVVSLARVNVDKALMSDIVEVVSSTGQLRRQVPASNEGTPWLWLGPDDVVRLRSPASRLANILVNDLSDEQLTAISAASIVAATGTAACCGHNHTQTIPAKVWIVPHGFIRPLIQATDDTGVVRGPDINHIGAGTSILTFSLPTAGTARCV